MSGSGGSGSQSTSQSISPELRPLFANTAGEITSLQQNILPQFADFFNNQVQQVPGLTSGQMNVKDMYNQRMANDPLNAQQLAAYDSFRGLSANPLNQQQQDAYRSLTDLTNSPVGSSPATQAAMQSVRGGILNDLAMSGMGNSDAVGSALSSAYAPIVAQEMQQRFQAIPMLGNLGQQAFGQQYQAAQGMQGIGQQAYGQQQQNFQNYLGLEEQGRGLEETQQQAIQADMQRRQQLGTQFTTGILSGFPSISGSVTKSKSSGGGMTVICTELYRQGFMDEATFEADQKFGEMMTAEIIAGYHRWARPVVRLMRRNSAFTLVVSVLARPWVKQMKYLVNQTGDPSVIGQLILLAGIPFCRWLGKRQVRAAMAEMGGD